MTHLTRRAHWATGLAATAVTVALAASLASAPASAAATTRPRVSHLSIRHGGAWGSDPVTVRGTGFNGTGPARVTAVMFGSHKAAGFTVENATTIVAYTPEVPDRRTVLDTRVVLRNGTMSRRTSADTFTFVVPTMRTRLNGNWSAAKSVQAARSMMWKTQRVNNQPVAHDPGYWTPAMGRSALHRAAGWLGLPYTWDGGGSSGPGYGSCYGDGLIGKFDCKIWGFDCSGLTLYAWARYARLDHYAATQHSRAGRFHPLIGELQPGDLMFFSEGAPQISHVTMYAGHGRVIQASESGWPVRYTPLVDIAASHPRYFGATRPTSTGRQNVGPTITRISAQQVPTTGGQTVTIHGRHLDTASLANFGSTNTYRIKIVGPREITVTVPAHAAGIAPVRVWNAWGISPKTDTTHVRFVTTGGN